LDVPAHGASLFLSRIWSENPLLTFVIERLEAHMAAGRGACLQQPAVEAAQHQKAQDD
jgi:hypothetical protein